MRSRSNWSAYSAVLLGNVWRSCKAARGMNNIDSRPRTRWSENGLKRRKNQFNDFNVHSDKILPYRSMRLLSFSISRLWSPFLSNEVFLRPRFLMMWNWSVMTKEKSFSSTCCASRQTVFQVTFYFNTQPGRNTPRDEDFLQRFELSFMLYIFCVQ